MARSSTPSLIAAIVAFVVCPAAFAQEDAPDDTYVDLDKPGKVITIEGNQGYQTYTLMKWEEGTKLDARNARWASYSWGKSMKHPTVSDTTRNNYPIQLGANWIGAYPVRNDLYNYGKCPAPVRAKLCVIGGGANARVRFQNCLIELGNLPGAETIEVSEFISAV